MIRFSISWPVKVGCFLMRITLKKRYCMKQLWQIMVNDFEKEGYTKYDVIKYSVVTFCALVGLLAIEGWIDSMCGL